VLVLECISCDAISEVITATEVTRCKNRVIISDKRMATLV
jgi:hypothetical protein